MLKRKMLVLFGVLLAGLAVVFLALQARGASAQPITLKEILFPQREQIAAPQIDKVTPTANVLQTGPTATVFPEGMPNPPTLESNWVIANPEQLAKNEAVIESARILIEKANVIYLTPGWVHIASKTESFFSLSDTLPDGSPIPTEWRDDTWYLMDENGYVMEAVGFQDTGSPKTFQVTKFKDGIWTNITLGTTFDIGEKTYDPRMESGFLADAEKYRDIMVLESETSMLGDEQVNVFSLTGRNVKPVEMAKSGHWIMGTSTKFYFSLKTGLLLQIEQYDIAPDGQYQLTRRITTIVVEKVTEPPAEVLKYLE